MNIGDIVKVFSSISDYDGQTGRIIHISTHPGVPAPFVVQFGDAISEPFSAAELVSMKPISSLWLETPLETVSAPHGASTYVRVYLGRVIAERFIKSERRRMTMSESEARRETLGVLGAEINRRRIALKMYTESPCLHCGKLVCSHR